MDNACEEYFISQYKCDFLNEGTFTKTSSVLDVTVILTWHNFDKALDFYYRIKIL